MASKRKDTISKEKGTWIAFDRDGVIGVSENSDQDAIKDLLSNDGFPATAVVFVPVDVYEIKQLVSQFSVVPR